MTHKLSEVKAFFLDEKVQIKCNAMNYEYCYCLIVIIVGSTHLPKAIYEEDIDVMKVSKNIIFLVHILILKSTNNFDS